MCVIFVAKTVRPTRSMLSDADSANPYGGGVAWREGGKVRYAKGLEFKPLADIVDQLPLPFVVHFRIPTAGGDCAELCHPFPISPEVPLGLSGASKGGVIFHNGHWANWGNRMQDALIHLGRKAPKGPWSDSRAMAFMASHYGPEILSMLDEKIVYFSPSVLRIYGKGWSTENGIECSNLQWKWKGTYKTPYSQGYSHYNGETWQERRGSHGTVTYVASEKKEDPKPTQPALVTTPSATPSTAVPSGEAHLTRRERRALRKKLQSFADDGKTETTVYLTQEHADVQKALAAAAPTPKTCEGAGCNNFLLDPSQEFCTTCQHEIERAMQDDFLRERALDPDNKGVVGTE